MITQTFNSNLLTSVVHADRDYGAWHLRQVTPTTSIQTLPTTGGTSR